MNLNVAGNQNYITSDSHYLATETDEFVSSLMTLSHIS